MAADVWTCLTLPCKVLLCTFARSFWQIRTERVLYSNPKFKKNKSGNTRLNQLIDQNVVCGIMNIFTEVAGKLKCFPYFIIVF